MQGRRSAKQRQRLLARSDGEIAQPDRLQLRVTAFGMVHTGSRAEMPLAPLRPNSASSQTTRLAISPAAEANKAGRKNAKLGEGRGL